MLDVYAGNVIDVNFNGAISACRYTYTGVPEAYEIL